MADDAGRGKKGERDAGVLGGLPSTRPSRMSRRARTGGTTAASPRSTLSVDATRAAATRAAATRSATGAAAGGAGGKRATAAEKTAKPKPRATPRPKAKPKPAEPMRPSLAVAPEPKRPRAVRTGSPALAEPAKKADALRPDVHAGRPAPSGTELATTVVQAAGELVQIGFTISSQILKRATQRLPKR